MARLIYSAITSLDGYVADEDGNFDWAAPDEEVHAFINDRSRPIGTFLFGRRMYEVLRYWDDPPDLARQPAVIRDYAEIWKGADKVVYSSTLDATSAPRTCLESKFDPTVLRRMKDSAEADLSVGGPCLAAEALRAGLVDEFEQFVNPVTVGGGTPWLPDGLRLELELLDERRFTAGVVYLRYRIRG